MLRKVVTTLVLSVFLATLAPSAFADIKPRVPLAKQKVDINKDFEPFDVFGPPILEDQTILKFGLFSCLSLERFKAHFPPEKFLRTFEAHSSDGSVYTYVLLSADSQVLIVDVFPNDPVGTVCIKDHLQQVENAKAIFDILSGKNAITY